MVFTGGPQTCLPLSFLNTWNSDNLLVEPESTKDRPRGGQSPATFSRKTPISSSAKYSTSCNLGYFLPPPLLAQKLALLPSGMTSRSCLHLSH